ncbi:MAG: response regulator, partial [Oxalobacteraceae bacterium]
SRIRGRCRHRCANPSAPAPAAPLLPPKTVLVLTPLGHHARVLGSYLHAWQMPAQHASDMEEALRLAGDMLPALAIVDGRLPQAGEAARMLAVSQPGVRLLLLLDDSDSDSARGPALRKQFHATLRRPFRQAALQEALLFALERRHYLVDAADLPPAGGKQDDAPETAAPGLVLLVEDNLINQKVALHQLGRLGYTAHVASNGEEALAAIALHDYALVLMDCQMPVLDGFEATRRIRDAERCGGRHLPIVAMTANAAEGDRERCLGAGMDDYLAKPIVRDALASMLRQHAAPLAPTGAVAGASLRTGTGAASGGGALRWE